MVFNNSELSFISCSKYLNIINDQILQGLVCFVDSRMSLCFKGDFGSVQMKLQGWPRKRFNFLDKESVTKCLWPQTFEDDVSALKVMSRSTGWVSVVWSVINSSWTVGAPTTILHALTIIMVPLATPEQSSSACQHWSNTRFFFSKWIGSIKSFKHVIRASARLSLQQEPLSVNPKPWKVNTPTCL